MKKTSHLVSREEVLQRYIYDENSGVFTSLIGRNRGQPIRTVTRNGYVSIGIRSKAYAAHRLAWLIHYGEWPDGQIDHINGVATDNRISNLRVASPSQNMANTRSRKCTTGYRGVFRDRDQFKAQIQVNRNLIYLGRYRTAKEASEAYLEAADKYFGEFAFHRSRGCAS